MQYLPDISKIGPYKPGIILGKGKSAEVYLGQHQSIQNDVVALKFFNPLPRNHIQTDPTYQQYMNESYFLAQLQNFNQQYKLDDIKYINELKSMFCLTSESRVIYLLILELATNGILLQSILQKGNLAEFICDHPDLPQPIQQLYQWQIARSIKLLHSLNVYHMDIKLNNILLDNNFVPKLSDFGQIENKNQSNEKKGTFGCMAPEVYQELLYSPQKADIFSLGLLFIEIKSGVPAFTNQPDQSQENYRNLFQCPDKYWNYIAQYSQKEHNITVEFEEDFKDLIIEMLQPNPDKRPTIDQVLNHHYFTKSQLLKETELTQYMASNYLSKFQFHSNFKPSTVTSKLKQLNQETLIIDYEQIGFNKFKFTNIENKPFSDFQKIITRQIDQIFQTSLQFEIKELPEMLYQSNNFNRGISFLQENDIIGLIYQIEENNNQIFTLLVDIQGEKMNIMKLKKNVRNYIKESLEKLNQEENQKKQIQ